MQDHEHGVTSHIYHKLTSLHMAIHVHLIHLQRIGQLLEVVADIRLILHSSLVVDYNVESLLS